MIRFDRKVDVSDKKKTEIQKWINNIDNAFHTTVTLNPDIYTLNADLYTGKVSWNEALLTLYTHSEIFGVNQKTSTLIE